MPQGLSFDFTLAQLKHNKLGGIPGGHAVECTVNDSEWPSDALLNDPSQTCDCGCGCKCDNFADVEPNAPDELRFTGGESTGHFFTGVPGESFPVDLERRREIDRWSLQRGDHAALSLGATKLDDLAIFSIQVLTITRALSEPCEIKKEGMEPRPTREEGEMEHRR